MFFQVYGANALVQWGMLLVVLAGLILWEWRTWPNTLICLRKKKISQMKSTFRGSKRALKCQRSFILYKSNAFHVIPHAVQLHGHSEEV